MANIEERFAIEGIEIKDGLARFGDNEELYKSVLLRFAQQRRDYKKPDASQEFFQYIHTIKGTAANIGINGVAALAKKVQDDLEAGVNACENFAALMTEFDLISKRIQENITPVTKSPVIVQDGTEEEYIACVNMLKETVALANVTDSGLLMNRLLTTRWNGIAEKNFLPLARAVEEYDFAKAKMLLDLL